MGLDNSLVIRGKKIEGKKILAKFFSENEDKWNPGNYEFGYWRKCYNIRSRTLEVFSDKGYDGFGGSISLALPDLWDFKEKVLKYFLNENNWYSGGISIWEWHYALVNIAKTIRDITEFLEYVEKEELTDDDFDIEFIDSY